MNTLRNGADFCIGRKEVREEGRKEGREVSADAFRAKSVTISKFR